MSQGDKSKIRILDPTCQSGKPHRQIEEGIKMYNDMTKKLFNKEFVDLSSKERARVSLYIAKAIHAFVKEDKTIIKIPHFFK
jgi:hypothetical protein